MGVADADGAPLFPCGFDQSRQLPPDRRPILPVVEKDMPPGAGNQIGPRRLFRHRGVGGPAVDEEKLGIAQTAHQPAHGPWIPRQQAAHVVVHSRHEGHGIQIPLQGSKQLPLRHTEGQSAGAEGITEIGLHRQMQHHLLVQLVRLARLLPGIGSLWQEGVGDGARERQGLLALTLPVAHVVDDQGDADRPRGRWRIERLGAGGCRQQRYQQQPNKPEPSNHPLSPHVFIRHPQTDCG